MLEKIARFFEDTVDDPVYSIKRGLAYILGKSGGQIAGLQLGLLAGPIIATIAGFDPSSATHFIGTTLAVGGVAGVSGYLVQVDFLHSRHSLLERYREEVGSLLGKAPDKVQEEDMELAARGDFKKGVPANPAIRRELRNSWLQRNIGVILSAVVSAATFLIVHEFDPGGMKELEHLLPGGHGTALDVLTAAVQGTTQGITLGGFAKVLGINGLAGLITYHTLKTPAHWVVSDILGIDEHSVNDRVTEIKRTLGHGREVQPEQVLGLFIHAHPDIEEQVKAEYGEEFDRMSREQKQALLNIVKQYMDIESVTEHINKGRIRPEELIFSAFGQKSGVEVADDGVIVHQGNVLDNMWQGLSALTGGFRKTADSPERKAQVSQGLADGLDGKTTVTVHTPDADHAHMHLENEIDEPGRRQSFAALVGRSVDHSADGLSHVERLEQVSHQQVAYTPN